MPVPRIVPISELRAGAAALVKEACESRKPVFITQRGRATAVLMSVEEYEEIDRARMIESIKRGKAQIRNGAQSYSLDEVMEAARAIITRQE